MKHSGHVTLSLLYRMHKVTYTLWESGDLEEKDADRRRSRTSIHTEVLLFEEQIRRKICFQQNMEA